MCLSISLEFLFLVHFSGGKNLCQDNDSECDRKEEDDVSDNDLEILGEQSGKSDTTNSTGDSSGGTEAPVKNVKIILTEEEEKFDKQSIHRVYYVLLYNIH